LKNKTLSFFICAVILVFPFSILSMEFDMGTIEVHDIKAVIDQDSFSEKSRFVFEESKFIPDENIKKDIDLSGELSELRDFNRSKWIKILIGDYSLEDILIGYEQKELNYLWKGEFSSFNKDVYRLPTKDIKKNQLKILYDDSYGKLSFSTESLFSEEKRYFAGSDNSPLNSYFVRHKKTFLSGNFYTPVIRGWNLNGFIDLEEKEVKKEWVPLNLGTYDNNAISISGQKEFDLWKNIFANLELTFNMDNIKFKGMERDADGFSINTTFNISNPDFSVISRLYIVKKGINEKDAFSVEYIKYLNEDNTFGIVAGREYKDHTFNDLYFSNNIILSNNILDVRGEEHDKFELYYGFNIDGWESKLTLGVSSISDLLYFYDINSNDRKVYPAYMKDIDRTKIMFESSKDIDEVSSLTLRFDSNNDENIVPYVPENRFKANYSYEYSQNTLFDLGVEFIGQYYNMIGGGLKNDSRIILDLDLKNTIKDNTTLLLSINNILDDENKLKPGFSEIGRNIELGIEHIF